MGSTFLIFYSTITWKSTSTLIPYASFIYSLSDLSFLKSSMFLLLSSLFYFSLSISSNHEDFFTIGGFEDDVVADIDYWLIKWLVAVVVVAWRDVAVGTSFYVGSLAYSPTYIWITPNKLTEMFLKSFLSFLCSTKCWQFLFFQLIHHVLIWHQIDLLLLLVIHTFFHLPGLVYIIEHYFSANKLWRVYQYIDFGCHSYFYLTQWDYSKVHHAHWQ